jgi:hypothetical protein
MEEYICIAGNRRQARRFWTAVAERSGDTALGKWIRAAKEAGRSASRRRPKCLLAAWPRCSMCGLGGYWLLELNTDDCRETGFGLNHGTLTDEPNQNSHGRLPALRRPR